MKKEQVYEISDEGINMKSESGDYSIKWTEIKKVSYFKTCFIWYAAKSLAILLPYSYFGSAYELNEFKEILNKNSALKRAGTADKCLRGK